MSLSGNDKPFGLQRYFESKKEHQAYDAMSSIEDRTIDTDLLYRARESQGRSLTRILKENDPRLLLK